MTAEEYLAQMTVAEQEVILDIWGLSHTLREQRYALVEHGHWVYYGWVDHDYDPELISLTPAGKKVLLTIRMFTDIRKRMKL